MKNRFLIIIAGPTAVGKTNVAIEIAKQLHAEIISCDSRQMYKEMRIGTAIPSDEELSEVKHHFIHNKSIHNYYNASMFENEVNELLNNLFQKHNCVIMTGGTGLYIDAVCKGIDDLPEIDPEIRQKLAYRFNSEGIESLRQELKIRDPEYYKTVDLRNAKRILKALEVCIMTGRPYSALLTKPQKERPYHTLMIGLELDRNELYARINKRVETMIHSGLVEEAKKLYPYRHLNALNTVGYKEIFEYLDGKITLHEATDLIQRNTRKYARRQITWFRKYKEMKWFVPSEKNKILAFIHESLAIA
ncbi:MAG: tRNA (adenosine(37)-N6)-dimethylallyltransferase MiaA [Bacteroidales bacterium]|nr:tRNA (adenosine(37)-N6)-dimethylallyltransferase MiaA [Bacteroidales bacterium]